MNQTADNFSLASPSTIREVAWYGFWAAGPVPDRDSFLLRFFSADDDVPSATAISEHSVTAAVNITSLTTTSGSGFFREYTAQLSVDLPAGDYWISILKTHPTLDQPSLWTWGESHLGSFQGGIARRQLGETDAWAAVPTAAERAFELRDSVIPEPSAAALLISTFALFVRRSR